MMYMNNEDDEFENVSTTELRAYLRELQAEYKEDGNFQCLLEARAARTALIARTAPQAREPRALNQQKFL